LKTFFVVLLTLLLVPPLAISHDCIDYGNYLHWVGSVDTPGDARGVAITDPYVYLATYDAGLVIAWQQCEDATSVPDDPGDIPRPSVSLRVHPNPFNPQTTISFMLERDEWAKVGVYELTGKRVAILGDRTFTGGEHSLTWNGRDVAGRSMPSGTYLVRLETESAVRVQKLTLIR